MHRRGWWWSDLQVAGPVVQGGPRAEAGPGPQAAVTAGPAELPPVHRVRGRRQGRLHVALTRTLTGEGGQKHGLGFWSHSALFTERCDAVLLARRPLARSPLRDASTGGRVHIPLVCSRLHGINK